MEEHLFITGGTGFIGSRLLRLWLERTNALITLLIRPRAGSSAKSQRRRALAALPKEWRNTCSGRIRLVRGDLALPQLGIQPDDWAALARSVTHIVHAGAVLRFNLALDQARRINTNGTAAVLDLARCCRRLVRFDYLSTAYVASRCQGVVLEDTCRVFEEHNNSYERSKYEAELLIRGAMAEVPAAILRPTVVTCDLQSGYAPATSAFFRLLHAVASGILTVLPGRPGTLLDLVPLDYIAEAAFAIGRQSDTAGRCFHLSAGRENLISLGDLRDLACAGFGRETVEILSPDLFAHWAADRCKVMPETSAHLEEISLYLPYLSHHPHFDNANAMRALDGTAVHMVAVPDYFDRVAAYVGRLLRK